MVKKIETGTHTHRHIHTHLPTYFLILFMIVYTHNMDERVIVSCMSDNFTIVATKERKREQMFGMILCLQDLIYLPFCVSALFCP